MATRFEAGLTEIGDGIYAYLQPDGSWGWSNAGLVCDDDEALLVDTLFDLKLTARMLESMAPLTERAPITTVVNTHANGDHCYGNELVTGAEIVATEASAAEMEEVPPALLASMLDADLPAPLGDYVEHCFGAFDFAGIRSTLPSRTFRGSVELGVGDRRVDVIEVGPAHTAGDAIVVAAEQRVAFAGDILFVGGTPVIWAGPVGNWIGACDRLADLEVDTIVPGHGPLTDAAGARDVRDYLIWLRSEVVGRFEWGMTPEDATFDIQLGGYADWSDAERLAVNVETIWRELDPAHAPLDVLTLFERMARLHAR